DFEEIPGEYL
nr:Chain I, Hirudin Variant-1 [synthetic construct]1HXF_I Chain I, Hirudin Variant [Hirudo medicinalis]